MSLVSSISYDQEEIIRNIMELFTGGKIDCDPTYSKGVFYKNIPEPRYKFDINPQAEGVVQADARDLPLKDGSVGSIMFDPPFLNQTGAGSIMKERFGDYRTIPILWDFYRGALKEFQRILAPEGVLVFKCQDTVSSRKNWFSHCEVMNMAVLSGFYPKDLFILLAKHRIPQHNLKRQEHARKFHSYFWVFEKRESRVSYSVA